MSAPDAFVYVDLDGTPYLAGRLWIHAKGSSERASFEYDDGWIRARHRFALEPALQIGKGPYHPAAGRALFSAIGDSAPDRWGRTLLARRERTPFLSAMSMLEAVDGEHRSYMEIADALRMHSASALQDLRELWRRVAFTVLISNTDDHLRNHGFLYAGEPGWRLSPAYDLNPVPTDVRPRILSTAIVEGEDRSASMDLAFLAAEHFGIAHQEAKSIAREVARAVVQWREVAVDLGASKMDCERMATAFEHDDLAAAR